MTDTNEIAVPQGEPENEKTESIVEKIEGAVVSADHAFVRSVRSLLDHMRAEAKHSILQTLLSDCEKEYKNLFD